MHVVHSRARFAAPALLLVSALLCLLPGSLVSQTASHVVISEVYGGGGNAGAHYTHDFVELYNPTAADIAMEGWSIQYQGGSGSGPFGAVAVFSGTIRSGGFFLIQANPGSGGTAPLPAPDAVASFSLAASSGKIALCSDAVPVTGPGGGGVVDFAGYGSANQFEGSGPAAAPGNTLGVERKAGPASDAVSMGPGGTEEHAGNARDTDDNAGDFIRREPDPQNSASPAEPAGGGRSVEVVLRSGWNLVSLPVDAEDTSAAALFPGAASPLYRYEGGYHAESAMVRGTGYWIRFAGPDTAAVSGIPRDPDTLQLAAGWNLVGSASFTIGSDELVEIPDGHLAGPPYGYDGAYRAADSLRSGWGYWLKSHSGGAVVIGVPPAGRSAGVGARRRRPVPVPPDLPPPPPPERHGERGGGTNGGSAGSGMAVDLYPNPSNPAATIGFTLDRDAEVVLEVVDPAGRIVAVPFRGSRLRGRYTVAWDGRGGSGAPLASGVYLVRLRAGPDSAVRKFVLLR